MRLAARLGVTKGGFHGCFAGRPRLLEEMLDEWERRFTVGVLAQADAEGGELSATDAFHHVDLAAFVTDPDEVEARSTCCSPSRSAAR